MDFYVNPFSLLLALQFAAQDAFREILSHHQNQAMSFSFEAKLDADVKRNWTQETV